MHFYTHDRLWPELADLTAAIDSKANLLAPESGGNPFDEAYSCPWAKIMDKFPGFPVEMACRSATLELRGELDVRASF
jgi:predicted deacylase